LPTDGNIIAAYADWGECDVEMVEAARNGANVLIWFAINLRGVARAGGEDEDAVPEIQGGPDLACVARVKNQLAEEGLPTTHLISVGGWDAPHPDTRWSGAEWLRVFDAWNMRAAVGNAGSGKDDSRLFDGFDWDLEGNDNTESESNLFTVECLELVGQMSAAAVAAGYNVTMCPPQSYMDPSTSNFSRSLRWPPVAAWHPEFHYHSRNSYAYLLAKYGGAFSLVSFQFYETYSAANYAISQLNQSFAEYLAAWTKEVTSGWIVDFAQDPSISLPSQRVAVEPARLIVGLTNGADPPPSKSLLLWPQQVSDAWSALEKAGEALPRGVMFWNAKMEGRVPNGTSTSLHLATAFNDILHVRQLQQQKQEEWLQLQDEKDQILSMYIV